MSEKIKKTKCAWGENLISASGLCGRVGIVQSPTDF